MSRNVQGESTGMARVITKTLVAGLISTTAMTIVMEMLYRTLPRDEQYALPPEEIATVAEMKVLGKPLNPSQHMIFTLVSHFGYGITLAGIYSVIAKKLPFPPLINGVSYGIAVWVGSYYGWLPAFRVLPSATEFPPERRTLMIIAHLVWGAVLGIIPT